MIETTLWIAIGGAIGSIARYWVALWMLPFSRDVPWGTMLINVVGSFVISFFGTLTVEHGRYALPELWRMAVMVGICGGFTTFSSFSLQTFELLRSGAPQRALINIGLSVTLCLASVTLGYLAAERLNGGVRQVADMQIEEDAG